MKISRRTLIAACFLVVAGVVLWWIYRPHQAESPKLTPSNQGNVPSLTQKAPAPIVETNPVGVVVPSQAEIEERKEQQTKALYLTPIAVYGKVVDEDGNSISGATVRIGIADRPFETGSSYTQTTDGGGLFSLANVHGIAFSVSASKDGYYSSEESTGHRNVVTPSRDDVQQPSKDRPMVLVLRKQTQPVPLIVTSSGQIDVPRTGQPTNIDLATGRKGQGELQVASWLGDSSQRPFSWRYQLSVASGGLIERKGEFDFEAPADGYQASAEINMPATAENWSSSGAREYFAKLGDGRYARFSIRFYPRQQRNFVVIETYINPKSHDRNLEFNPNKLPQP
jgi:hypothetical protein